PYCFCFSGYVVIPGSVDVLSFDPENHKDIRYKEDLCRCSYSISNESDTVDGVFMVHPKGFHKKTDTAKILIFLSSGQTCAA
ncbi:MAG: hypothetical protein OXC48_01035, partial [Endozoicomonadaceae bacterium]|nr:hypothetical protein [Endozoicomonadaceae bacterium]